MAKKSRHTTFAFHTHPIHLVCIARSQSELNEFVPVLIYAIFLSFTTS
jgi:hypothetical protein